MKVLIISLVIFLMGSLGAIGQDSENKDSTHHSIFIDTLDHAFDVSSFLYAPTGFMPIPLIITEPAVGLGGGAALLFFHPNDNPVIRSLQVLREWQD